jgi:hypothetical protein
MAEAMNSACVRITLLTTLCIYGLLGMSGCTTVQHELNARLGARASATVESLLREQASRQLLATVVQGTSCPVIVTVRYRDGDDIVCDEYRYDATGTRCASRRYAVRGAAVFENLCRQVAGGAQYVSPDAQSVWDGARVTHVAYGDHRGVSYCDGGSMGSIMYYAEGLARGELSVTSNSITRVCEDMSDRDCMAASAVYLHYAIGAFDSIAAALDAAARAQNVDSPANE